MQSQRAINSKLIITIVQYLFLVTLLVIFLLPIVTVLLMSFKTSGNALSSNVLSLPDKLNFNNYITAFVDGKMLTGFKNTFVILFFSLIGTVINAAMVAFVLNRFNFKFNKIINILLAGAVMIPLVVTQVATFQVINFLGLYGSLAAPVVLYLGTDIVSVYIFIQFMENISVSLDEAAIVDGCNYFQVFYKMIIPLTKPAIITVIITKGINIYNDFYIPYLYIPGDDTLTISTSLYKFQGPYGSKWEIICAGVIIILIPTLIIFILLQKQIYSGLVSGSVKE